MSSPSLHRGQAGLDGIFNIKAGDWRADEDGSGCRKDWLLVDMTSSPCVDPQEKKFSWSRNGHGRCWRRKLVLSASDSGGRTWGAKG
jgi:hypothetical protein